MGTTTFSPLRVSRAVKRHWMSVTWPDRSSILIQSPISSELSICRARPPSRLPRVSCIEMASTAVRMAEVANRWLSSTPARFRRKKPQPM